MPRLVSGHRQIQSHAALLLAIALLVLQRCSNSYDFFLVGYLVSCWRRAGIVNTTAIVRCMLLPSRVRAIAGSPASSALLLRQR